MLKLSKVTKISYRNALIFPGAVKRQFHLNPYLSTPEKEVLPAIALSLLVSHLQAVQYHAKAHQFCAAFPKDLDADTLKVVHATAPAVAGNMSRITNVFYDIMLSKYPVTKVCVPYMR
jgi:hypothetical protein